MRRVHVLLGAALLAGSVVVGGAAPASAEPAPADCTIIGTNGPDVLVGTPGPDVICGLGGKDTLRGRGGDDVLDGGAGKDLIRGGKGDDLIRAKDGAVDDIRCGKGNDRVSRDDTDQTRKCEARVSDEVADPSKMRAYGPGLEGGTRNDETYFTVETVSSQGQKIDVPIDPLAVRITDERGHVLPTTMADSGDGTFSVRYTPVWRGPHNIAITWGGVAIANTPFVVLIDKDPDLPDSSKCRAYGPGLEGGTAGATATFFLELNVPSGQPYPGDLNDLPVPLVVQVLDPSGATVPLARSLAPRAGTLQFDYVPPSAGMYRVEVSVDGEQVPGSVFSVPIS
jgi:hypothetical protein